MTARRAPAPPQQTRRARAVAGGRSPGWSPGCSRSASPSSLVGRSSPGRRRTPSRRASATPSSTGRPPWLKDFAISTFGTNDKLVLLVGAVARAGRCCARSPAWLARRGRRGPWSSSCSAPSPGGGGDSPAATPAVTRRPAVLAGAVAAIGGGLALDRAASTGSARAANRRARRPDRPRRCSARPASVAGAGVAGAGSRAGSAASARRAAPTASPGGVRLPAPADATPAGRPPASTVGRRRRRRRSGCRTATSTGSTPRSSCPRSTPTTGSCGSTAWSSSEVDARLRRRCSPCRWIERARHADLRLERGRRRPGRQRPLARAARSATLLARAGPQAGADMVLSTQRRRLHRRHAAGGADRRAATRCSRSG